jgi:hypothetical protein
MAQYSVPVSCTRRAFTSRLSIYMATPGRLLIPAWPQRGTLLIRPGAAYTGVTRSCIQSRILAAQATAQAPIISCPAQTRLKMHVRGSKVAAHRQATSKSWESFVSSHFYRCGVELCGTYPNQGDATGQPARFHEGPDRQGCLSICNCRTTVDSAPL